MMSLFLLSVYVASWFLLLLIGGFYLKRNRGTWGELCWILVFSFIPVFNTIVVMGLAIELINETGFFNRRVFKD